jgi:hypothetical protein
MRYVVLLISVLAACSASAGDLSELFHQEPESWAKLEVGALNGRVEEAVSAQEAWPRSPLLVAVHLLCGDLDTRSLVLEEVKNRGESADETRISCIRDGFLDDSIRGDWHELDLRRLADGTWRIRKAQVAVRCWRSEHTDVYQAKPCP